MSEDLRPWPKRGESLFRFDIGDYNNACLNFVDDQFDLYAVGYKRAADLLVEHAINTRSNQDILVYPIVFLYRHYLELRMKDIIKDGNRLFDINEQYSKDHKIIKSWEKCKEIIEKLDDNKSVTDEVIAIEENMQQLSRIDPQSMAFRYPTDKSDKPSLPGIKNINLGNLRDVMAGISNFLDATCQIICVELDFKNQAEELYDELNKAAEAEFNATFHADEW